MKVLNILDYLEPMKYWSPSAKKKEEIQEKALKSGDYFMMPKVDGAFYRYVSTDKESFLFSRQESVKGGYVDKKENVPHIMTFLNEKFPPNSMVLGEIGYPGGVSSDTTSIMGCLPAKSLLRQKDRGFITYFIFDVLFYDGEPIWQKGAWERQLFLDKIISEQREKQQTPFFINYLDYYHNDLNEKLQEILAKGSEGVVLYKKNEPYHFGKRPAHATLKIKKSLDALDVICLGFENPTKEYTGTEIDTWPYWEGSNPITKLYANNWCGAIRFGVYKNNSIVELGTVASGLTDEIRAAIAANPEGYHGKPMLLKAMETTEDAIRHPVFVSFRDDIDVKDCTYDKIFQ